MSTSSAVSASASPNSFASSAGDNSTALGGERARLSVGAIFPPLRVGGPQCQVPQLRRRHLPYPCRYGGVGPLVQAGRPLELLAVFQQFRHLLGCYSYRPFEAGHVNFTC